MYPLKTQMLKSQPRCDAVRRWGVWEVTGPKGRAPINGISALIKETLRARAPSTMRRHSKKTAVHKPGKGSSTDTPLAVTSVLELPSV